MRFSMSLLKRWSSSANRRTFSGSMIAWAMLMPFVGAFLPLLKHTDSGWILREFDLFPGKHPNEFKPAFWPSPQPYLQRSYPFNGLTLQPCNLSPALFDLA